MSTCNILQKHRKEILSTIDNKGMLIQTLYASRQINEKQYQTIKAEDVQFRAAIKIFENVLHSGTSGFFKFCEALNEEYDWLSKMLLLDAKEMGINWSCNKEEESSQAFSIPLEVGNCVPCEQQLMKFSKTLVHSEWQSVLYELGLSMSNIDHCKETNPTKALQCMSGVVFWQRKKGKHATFHALFEACVNAEVNQDCLDCLIKIASGK